MLKILLFVITVKEAAALFSFSACETGKICVLSPDGCNTNPTTCKMGISFKKSGSYLELELFTTNLPSQSAYNSYMAVGFQASPCADLEKNSTKPCMASAPVIECSALNGRLMSPTVSWNTALPENVRIANAASLATAVGLSMSALENANGQTYCKVTQRITGVSLNGISNSDKIFQYNPSAKYGILMAVGATNGSEDLLIDLHIRKLCFDIDWSDGPLDI